MGICTNANTSVANSLTTWIHQNQSTKSKKSVKTCALGVLEVVWSSAISPPRDAGKKHGEDDHHTGDGSEDDGDENLPAQMVVRFLQFHSEHCNTEANGGW